MAMEFYVLRINVQSLAAYSDSRENFIKLLETLTVIRGARSRCYSASRGSLRARACLYCIRLNYYWYVLCLLMPLDEYWYWWRGRAAYIIRYLCRVLI